MLQLRCGAGAEPGCGADVDACGDHSVWRARRSDTRAAWCPNNGWHAPPHRVCLRRTAGAGILSSMERCACMGAALCCGVTLVSPLRADGRPHPSAADRDGAAQARGRYPELLRAGPQRRVVLATEVGGRWCDEAVELVRALARLRAEGPGCVALSHSRMEPTLVGVPGLRCAASARVHLARDGMAAVLGGRAGIGRAVGTQSVALARLLGC